MGKKLLLVALLILLSASVFATTKLQLVVNDGLKECFSESPSQDRYLPEGWKFVMDAAERTNVNEQYSDVYKTFCENIGYTYTNQHFSYPFSQDYLIRTIMAPIALALILGLIGAFGYPIVSKKRLSLKERAALFIGIAVAVFIIIELISVIFVAPGAFA